MLIVAFGPETIYRTHLIVSRWGMEIAVAHKNEACMSCVVVMMIIAASRSLCSFFRLCYSALGCPFLSPTHWQSRKTCFFCTTHKVFSSVFVILLFIFIYISHLLSFLLLSLGSFNHHVFQYSFWFPVQRQVWLQYRAARSKQATGHCWERSGHGLPPCSWSGADRQLHRSRLHNWGHGYLSGKVCQKHTHAQEFVFASRVLFSGSHKRHKQCNT